MNRKLNKRRALRNMAKDAPDVKTITIKRRVFEEADDSYYVWRTYFEPWAELIKIKYGRPMDLVTSVVETDDKFSVTIRSEVKR